MKIFKFLFRKYTPDFRMESNGPFTRIVDQNAYPYNRELYGFCIILWFVILAIFIGYVKYEYIPVDNNYVPIGSIEDRVDTIRFTKDYWYVKRIKGNKESPVFGYMKRSTGEFVKEKDTPFISGYAAPIIIILAGILEKKDDE